MCDAGARVGHGGPVLPVVAGPTVHHGEGHGAEKPGGHLPRGPAAFIRSVEMALPFLTGEEGLCPLLETLIGNVRAEEAASRWRTLIFSACRTGREFQDSYDLLHREAEDWGLYLGEELEGELSVGVKELGDGRVDGSTRALITRGEAEVQGAAQGP